MKLIWRILEWSGGAVILWLVIIILIYLLFPCTAHSAEPQSAVIEFTSAEDLIARTDSVIAVRDMAWETVYTGYPKKIGANVLVEIRHRTLVGVTVTGEPDTLLTPNPWSIPAYPLYSKKFIPGTAIVWFGWEVE